MRRKNAANSSKEASNEWKCVHEILFNRLPQLRRFVRHIRCQAASERRNASSAILCIHTIHQIPRIPIVIVNFSRWLERAQVCPQHFEECRLIQKGRKSNQQCWIDINTSLTDTQHFSRFCQNVACCQLANFYIKTSNQKCNTPNPNRNAN